MSEATATTATKTANVVTRRGDDYFLDGQLITEATLTCQKGRGKKRRWIPCEAWQIPLAMWKAGAIVANGWKWTVELKLADGGGTEVSLDDFLKAVKAD